MQDNRCRWLHSIGLVCFSAWQRRPSMARISDGGWLFLTRGRWPLRIWPDRAHPLWLARFGQRVRPSRHRIAGAAVGAAVAGSRVGYTDATRTPARGAHSRIRARRVGIIRADRNLPVARAQSCLRGRAAHGDRGFVVKIDQPACKPENGFADFRQRQVAPGFLGDGA